jgi:serine/threonine-protein kinase
VTLSISKGSDPTVPYVIGRTQAEAESLIKAAGFSVAHAAQEYSSSVPSGSVIRQDPGEGAKGVTTVTITVSKGPEPPTTPVTPVTPTNPATNTGT